MDNSTALQIIQVFILALESNTAKRYLDESETYSVQDWASHYFYGLVLLAIQNLQDSGYVVSNQRDKETTLGYLKRVYDTVKV